MLAAGCLLKTRREDGGNTGRGTDVSGYSASVSLLVLKIFILFGGNLTKGLFMRKFPLLNKEEVFL